MSRIEKPCRYVCHKWLLFTICFILIYFNLMLILFCENIASLYQNEITIYRTVMVESIVSILFSLIGMIGAYKENYCSTVLYAIFMTLSVVSEIYSSIVAPIFWFLTVLYILVTIISFSFARLIRERLIDQVLQPQTAFMRDYGRTYGLRFNSYHFYYQNNNPVVQLDTNEFEGRQLPPYYSNCDNQMSNLDTQALPPYEEYPPYPPSYQETMKNVPKNNGNNSHDSFVQHI